MSSSLDVGDPTEYARAVADSSFDWYKSRAIRSRKLFRTAEVVRLVLGAMIPVAALWDEVSRVVPAAIGALALLVGGLASVFGWQENYLRFSGAREAVESERRRYILAIDEYGDADTKDAELVRAVTQIEQKEMGQWLSTTRARGESTAGSEQST